MASAPTPTKNGGPRTWDKLSESEKNEFFKNITSDGALKKLIDDYNVEIDVKGIRGLHELETSSDKKDADESDKPEQKHTKHHGGESHNHRHITEFEPSFHDAFKEDGNYQDIHKQESAKYIADYEKKYKKSPTQEEINKHVNPIAEAKFRTINPDAAHELEQKEINTTRAASLEEDNIAKQYHQRAEIAAREEIERKFKKKDPKISEAEYRKQESEIYKKHRDYQDIQFAQKYTEKAAHYASTEPLTEPRMTNAIEKITKGREWRKQQQQKQKEATRKTQGYTPTQATKGKNAVTKAGVALPKVPKGAIGINRFRKQREAIEYGNKRHELDIQAVKDYEAIHGPIPNGEKEKRKKPSIRSIQNLFKKLQEQESGFSAGENFEPQQFGQEPLDLRNELDANSVEGSLSPVEGLGEEALAPVTEGLAPAVAPVAPLAGAAGAEVVVEGGTAAAATFPVWGIVALVLLGLLFLLLIIIIIMNVVDDNNATVADVPIAGLTIIVKGPTTIPNGGTGDYTADITCTAECARQGPLTFYYENLPTGITVKSADQPYTTTPYPITWSTGTLGAAMASATGFTHTLRFTLQADAKANNSKIGVIIKGDIVGGTGNTSTTQGGATSSVPANSNNCYSNQYVFDFNNNTILGFGPKNFGDPNCELTAAGSETKIADIVTQLDPANKYRWYNVIFKCESHYDPNIEELVGSVDAAHAWGLAQMGRGLNGPLDHGDVYWKDQIANAINYNKTKIGGNFSYWATRNYNPDTCTP